MPMSGWLLSTEAKRQLNVPKKTTSLLQWQDKGHTLKAQLVVDQASGQILSTALAKDAVMIFASSSSIRCHC